MNFLTQMAGNFLTGVGQEGLKQEEEARQLRLQEAIENRRAKQRQKEQLMLRTLNAQDDAAKQNASGPAIGYDDTGKASLMRIQAEVDPRTSLTNYRRERVADAPVTTTGKIRKYRDKGEWITEELDSTGAWNQIATSPTHQPGSGRGGREKAPPKVPVEFTRLQTKIDEASTVGELNDIRKSMGLSPTAPDWLNLGEAGTDLVKVRKDALKGIAGKMYQQGNATPTQATEDGGGEIEADTPEEMDAKLKRARPDLTPEQRRVLISGAFQ